MDHHSTGRMRSLDRGGCLLSYRVTGEGTPIVLVQGAGTHGDGWRPQVDALAGRHRCLTFDNRGIGLSQPPGGTLSVERMADDVAALMEAEGWPSAHLVGHSLGGPIAVQLALSDRTRVRSLALLCTFADGRKVAPLSRRMAWAGLRVQFGWRRLRRRAFLELIVPPEVLRGADRRALAARFAPLFGHDLADQPPIVPEQLEAMRRYDATARLAELANLPTIVASAQRDPIAPPSLGRALADGIPGARYVEWPGASHGIALHQPERVNSLLAEHFAEADRNSSP